MLLAANAWCINNSGDIPGSDQAPSGQAPLNWNWKSVKTFGHTLNKYGAGPKITRNLRGRAGGTGTPQGQWLDNNKAAAFLQQQRPGLTGPQTVLQRSLHFVPKGEKVQVTCTSFGSWMPTDQVLELGILEVQRIFSNIHRVFVTVAKKYCPALTSHSWFKEWNHRITGLLGHEK
jgi:hypothetical protein